MRRTLAAALAFLAACDRPAPDPAAPRPASPPAPAAAPAAPDRIAFSRRGEIWSVAPDGSDPRPVARLGDVRASDPAWSPDRLWIAFAADTPGDLLSRNLFVVRADGSELRQVTPVPRAGASLEDAPKASVTGRAVLAEAGVKRAAPGLRVSVYGLRREASTDADGRFRAFLPVGGGWVKVSGNVADRAVTAFTFASASEGRTVDLGDLILRPGGDDAAAAPAWSPDRGSLCYQYRHGRLDPTGLAPSVTLRRIRLDGQRDETLYAPSRATVLAGPVVRGGRAWIKTSDGRILDLELATGIPRASPEWGAAVPDLLALSPDGSSAVTLRGDEMVLLRSGSAVPLAAFPKDDPRPRAADFSPDGTRLVLDRWGADGKADLWTFELATRRFSRITEDGASASPAWHGR